MTSTSHYLRLYVDTGLSALPALAKEKRPALRQWRQYQNERPTRAQVEEWANSIGFNALCIIAGAVSRNMEFLDFDQAGELYEKWAALVEKHCPGLLKRLVIERTPSGGWHVGYRCLGRIPGNMKLAQRRIVVASKEDVTIMGKTCKPRKDRSTGEWFVMVVLIETRGEGGLCLVAPSPKYVLTQGTYDALPMLTEAERHILIDAAFSLNEDWPVEAMPREYRKQQEVTDSLAAQGGDVGQASLRPGDDFNARGDVRAVLETHGWHCIRGGENEYWTRPGKETGTSATLKNNVFYVFSSNADPFEPNRGYAPFAVYALLEHGGDYAAAAKALRLQGYGGVEEATRHHHDHDHHLNVDQEVGSAAAAAEDTGTDEGENSPASPGSAAVSSESAPPTGLAPADALESAQVALDAPLPESGPAAGSPEPAGAASSNQGVILTLPAVAPEDRPAPEYPDPGPLPHAYLRVPGFISELMDLTLESAPYPNPVLAFSGALCMQAFLAGRRVRDCADNRTNLYLLGLAHSAAGKDWPRKVNIRLMQDLDMLDQVGERFASGEGLQDALLFRPCMLFQTDEFDGMLQSINKAQDSRFEMIMTTMLFLYSSANAVYPMRRKAGIERPGHIDQPCLTVFGTAIPNHFYEALSDRMLTNGLFARCIILESGQRQDGQDPKIIQLPERILKTAAWWREFRGDANEFFQINPKPRVVPDTACGKEALRETRQIADIGYREAESRQDAVAMALWGRVNENVRKLALLYAVSRSYLLPQIDAEAVGWARNLVLHQARRMLFMAQEHVARNEFQADCLKFLRKLREAPGCALAHKTLLKRMKLHAQTFSEVVDTLMQRGEIYRTMVLENKSWHAGYRLGESKAADEALIRQAYLHLRGEWVPHRRGPKPIA
ncbi:MAG: bifunctional DNA primase/polymerase [Planctomycetota bacterium]